MYVIGNDDVTFSYDDVTYSYDDVIHMYVIGNDAVEGGYVCPHVHMCVYVCPHVHASSTCSFRMALTTPNADNIVTQK